MKAQLRNYATTEVTIVFTRCHSVRATLFKLACVCVAGTALIGCGDDARTTAPTSPTSPTAPTTRTLTSVTVTGIVPVTPGRTTQLSALAHFSDNSQSDVTATATWASSNLAVAAVSAAGLLTASGFGEADITARVDTVVGQSHLTVTTAAGQPLPPGSFVVSGSVHETAPTISTALADVRIEVTGGELSGQVFNTDGQGRFSLPSTTQANFAVYFKKAGYEDLRYEVREPPRDQHPDIGLVPALRTIQEAFAGFGRHNDISSSFPVHHDGVVTLDACQINSFESYDVWLESEGTFILPQPIVGFTDPPTPIIRCGNVTSPPPIQPTGIEWRVESGRLYQFTIENEPGGQGQYRVIFSHPN